MQFAVLGLLWCGVWPLMKPEKADTALAVEEQPQHITAAAGALLRCTSCNHFSASCTHGSIVLPRLWPKAH